MEEGVRESSKVSGSSEVKRIEESDRFDGVLIDVVGEDEVWNEIIKKCGSVIYFNSIQWKQWIPGLSNSTNNSSNNSVQLTEKSNNVQAKLRFIGRQLSPSIAESQSILSLYKKAYVYIFVVNHFTYSAKSETTGITVRSRLKAFVDVCHERNLEFLILYVALPRIPLNSPPKRHHKRSASAFDSSRVSSAHFDSSANLSSLKSEDSFSFSSSSAGDPDLRAARKLFDKLKSAVNSTRGKERCILVRELSTEENQLPQVITNRLIDTLNQSIEQRIHSYQDELQKTLSNRILPGWSFCSYVSMKQFLASIYQQLSRYDLASRCYDELNDMAFHTNSKYYTTNSNLNRTSANIETDLFANGLLLLYSKTTKFEMKVPDFDRMIFDGKISALDLRIFFYVKQAILLLSVNKMAEFAERSLQFVSHFCTVLRECVPDEQDHEKYSHFKIGTDDFIEVWKFCACRIVTALIEPRLRAVGSANGYQLPTSADRRSARCCADLICLGLESVLKLSSKWAESSHGSHEQRFKELRQDPNGNELYEALKSRVHCEKVLAELAFSAASLYRLGGRPRYAASFGGLVGRDYLTESMSNSVKESLLSVQCGRLSVDSGWNRLHARARESLAQVERKLGKFQEYLLSCLGMLQIAAHSNHAQNDVKNHLQMSKEFAQCWIQEATEAAAKLPRVMKYKLDRLVEVSVAKSTLEAGDSWRKGKRPAATVHFKSFIPSDFVFDSVAVEFHCTEKVDTSESMRFSPENESAEHSDELLVLSNANPIKVVPGTSEFEVISADPIPHSGYYDVAMIVLYLGKLKLVHGIQQAAVIESGMASNTVDSEIMLKDGPRNVFDRTEYPRFFAGDHSWILSFLVPYQPISVLMIPGVIQYVALEVKAGPSGIPVGTEIVMRIRAPQTQKFGSSLVLMPDVMKENESDVRFRVSDGMKVENCSRIDVLNAFEAGQRISLEIPVVFQSISCQKLEERLDSGGVFLCDSKNQEDFDEYALELRVSGHKLEMRDGYTGSFSFKEVFGIKVSSVVSVKTSFLSVDTGMSIWTETEHEISALMCLDLKYLGSSDSSMYLQKVWIESNPKRFNFGLVSGSEFDAIELTRDADESESGFSTLCFAIFEDLNESFNESGDVKIDIQLSREINANESFILSRIIPMDVFYQQVSEYVKIERDIQSVAESETLIPFRFRIAIKTKHEIAAESLQYCIEFERESWIMFGKSRGKIQCHRVAENSRVLRSDWNQILILAQRIGFLSLPQIRIESKQHENIRIQYVDSTASVQITPKP